EGAGVTFDVVRHDGETGVGEALRIAVGVDDDAAALRRQGRQHAVEDRNAAELDARLVAAAHAAGKPAGKHEAEGRGVGVGHAGYVVEAESLRESRSQSSTAALRRCLVLSSSTKARS